MAKEPTEYKPRTVRDWLERLLSGSLALPRFQRSYLWTDRKISDLIIALLDGRPVGTILLIDRYTEPVRSDATSEELRSLERFATRSLSGTDTDLDSCTELILDGQQRLTSLWRALGLGKASALQETERHERHAFLEVDDIWAEDLRACDIVWPRKAAATGYLQDPGLASARNLIPLSLFNPKNADPRRGPKADPLSQWCGEVCNNQMTEGNELWWRISEQIRGILLGRKIWYAKLPTTMERRDAIEVFIKVNESSSVIKKFDIAVAEFDSLGGTQASLRQEIAGWAERNTHSERFFGPDEEKMIPRVGELILKIACLQEDMTPTDKNFTAPEVLRRLNAREHFQTILRGIEWTFEFLEEERIWKDKHLPSAVPLRVLPALFPEFRALADASDMEGAAKRHLRAYLWRAFVTDRYQRSANTRLQQDFLGLRGMLRQFKEIDDLKATLSKRVPIFGSLFSPPGEKKLCDLDNPLAPPTRKDSLSRSLLVVSLQKGAKDFASGASVSSSNIGSREAHHLFPKGFLKDYFDDVRQINHCLNYALVSGPTNKRIAAKAPIDYLKDRYKTDTHLGERELRDRVESHLIPFDALAVQKGKKPALAYRGFVRERARLLVPAIGSLVEGNPI